jgi:hypothetical protein
MAAIAETNICSDFKEITNAIMNFKLQRQAPQICVLGIVSQIAYGKVW